MSKKFKTQASSGRAAGGFGALSSSPFASGHSSTLSYIQETPDYSGVSDANVVVAFKNLSKKDGTTKAKALEELSTYVSLDNKEIEDTVLEAWVKLYPRLSIDSARRVRQLAQSLNAEIFSSCGKRTVKHLPRIAGPWLASGNDNDRAVAKAAREGLAQVFPSVEKIAGLKKAFQGSILEYCRDACLHETPKTLSDERSVTPDDAEATYARVLASSLTVVANLSSSLPIDEISKQEHIYEEIMADQKAWSFVSHSDASVRRAFHRLVQSFLQILPEIIGSHVSSISTAYLYKGLASDQTGSGFDYLQTVSSLTVSIPQVWTTAYAGKKSVSSRLRLFLRNGSHSGPSKYWDLLSEVLPMIPEEVLPSSYEEAYELTMAARDGVTKKDERLNALTAWSFYHVLVNILSARLSNGDDEKLLETCVLPIVSQYLQPSPDTAEWTIFSAKAATIVSQAAYAKKVVLLLECAWPNLGSKLIDTAKMSQPEQSKDFEKSQIHVASSGERWANLQRELFVIASAQDSLSETYLSTNRKILDSCISLLRAREGKPFGAAAIIEELLRKCGSFLLADSGFKSSLSGFMLEDVPNWIVSTSRRQLAMSLLATEDETSFPSAYSETLQRAIKSDLPREIAIAAVRDLLPHSAPQSAIEIAKADTSFQEFASNLIDPEDSTLFSSLVNLGALETETVDLVLSRLTTSLSTSSSGDALLALDAISRTSQSAVQAYMSRSGTISEQLLPGVIQMEDSPSDEVANKATALAARLSSATGDTGTEARFGVVLRGLQSIGPHSPTIDTLQDLMNRILGLEKDFQKHIDKPSEVIPSFEMWTGALVAAVEPPCPSLAILSPLSGGVYLLPSRRLEQRSAPVPLDREGLSQALRIAMYVRWLLRDTDILQVYGSQPETKAALVALLYMTVLLTEDNLSVVGVNNLWHPHANQILESSIVEFLTDANSIMGTFWKNMTPPLSSNTDESTECSHFTEVLENLRSEYSEKPAISYYIDLALANVNANLFELHGHNSNSVKAVEELFKASRSGNEVRSVLACIVGFQSPLSSAPSLARCCNELVADLTVVDTASHEKANKGLEQLVLLNAILHTQEDAVEVIAKQRLIFLVKHLIPVLINEIHSTMAAEVCKALTMLLPGMWDMYGEHWSQILSYLTNFWSLVEIATEGSVVKEEEVLLMHATLNLYATLQKLSKADEPNEDLIDALKEAENQTYGSLIHLLKTRNGLADDDHQPLQVTHGLLARQIAQLPRQPLKDADELYPLLYAPSSAIQQAAFDLLHKEIPAVQEQISFDAALDNKTARLPDELISLLLEAPTLNSLADAVFTRAMPRQLQGYLYGWRLLFDHFVESSYRVKNDYIEQLKDGAYLDSLLSLTFDFLGHTRGRPVDASKFDIRNYIPDIEPSPEKDVQWLLIHLYYLALINLPSSVKSYYLDIRSRQTSQAVETWTAKYISPLIVNASLEAVAEWSEKSVKEDPEYEKMSVKVGMKSKEITVSYVVDEQTMAIKVVLPEAYPLASAEVLSVNRVAVKEEKWQSWLRNCRGVIIFSNGSITDGLNVWQKNVTGALKGQTECAICYSIISGDKQLPTKRCPTCKHLFHGSCLHKWFKTSNASTCPLCRNPFSFN